MIAQLEREIAKQGVELRAVECLSNCDHGCSIVLRGGASRWTYVYANLNEADHVDTIVYRDRRRNVFVSGNGFRSRRRFVPLFTRLPARRHVDQRDQRRDHRQSASEL